MLEILKKIASVALDVQHIQRVSTVLYSTPNIPTENVSKFLGEIKTALDDVSTNINLMKELMDSSINDKKD